MTGVTRYRRAVLRGPGVLEVEDAVAPSPGPGDLLVAPDAVGICGTDLELLEGTMAYLTSGRAAYPIVPGHEWTGIVVGVGEDVGGFSEGDRVVGECTVSCGVCDRCQRPGAYHLCANRTETGIMRRDGALATRLAFPARAAHRIPEHVEARDAALIEPLAVSLRGVRRAGALAGRPLAIIGAGTIGLLSALLARAEGAGPIHLVEIDAERRALASSQGFAVSAGPDVPVGAVVEASGTPGGIGAAISMTADGGTLVLLGLTGQPEVPLDVDGIVVRDLSVIGSLGSPSMWPEAVDLVASGRVEPSVVVTHEFELDEAVRAYETSRAGAGKVLITP
jgi:L-iditol 2-dehydrogenase